MFGLAHCWAVGFSSQHFVGLWVFISVRCKGFYFGAFVV